MLSRGNSTSTSRLQRAKSSSSVKNLRRSPTRSDSIDPEIARLHALAAASCAFERAEGGRSSFFETNPVRNDSTKSQTAVRSYALSRRSSVRFAEEAGLRRRQSIEERCRAGMRSVEDPYINAPTKHQRSHQGSPISRLESYITASADLDRLNIPEDDVSSSPSSYRRIRKARSMFYDTKPPSLAYPETTMEGYQGVKPLRTPKSLSFLRGGTDYLTPSIRRNKDEAIRLARQKYLEHLEEQRLKERSFFALASTAKRRETKNFRKTVRTNSQTRYGNAIASPNQGLEVQKHDLAFKARKISLSIRNRVKKVFGAAHKEQENIPIQQLDASREHFRDYSPEPQEAHQNFSGLTPLGDAELLCVNSRVPSLRSPPSYAQVSSTAASLRSKLSDDDASNGKSRVTSWTDSTSNNTFAVRQAIEKKRLSIIQEQNLHQHSSPSVDHQGYDAFRYSKGTHVGAQSPVHVDSRTVYEALRRRIDGASQQESSETLQKSFNDQNGEQGYGMNHITHPQSTNLKQSTPITVRRVISDSPNTVTRAHPVRLTKSIIFHPKPPLYEDDVFFPEKGNDFHTFIEQQDRPLSESTNGSVLRPTLDRESQFVPAPTRRASHRTLTPQHVSDYLEEQDTSQKPGTLPREAQSSFFPYPDGVKAPTPSPYRRAMNLSNTKAIELDDTESLQSIRMDESATLSPGTRRRITIGSSSVYSRTTSGNTPIHGRDGVPLDDLEGTQGTATIIVDDLVQRNDRTQELKSQGHSSRSSSGEWRKWMSTQVAHLEKQAESLQLISRLKPFRHNRENAQISGDDTEIGDLQTNKQPLAAMHVNVPPRSFTESKAAPQTTAQGDKRSASGQPHLMQHQLSYDALAIRKDRPNTSNATYQFMPIIRQIKSHGSFRSSSGASSNQQLRGQGAAKTGSVNGSASSKPVSRTRSNATLRLHFKPKFEGAAENSPDYSPPYDFDDGLGPIIDGRLGPLNFQGNIENQDPGLRNDHAAEGSGLMGPYMDASLRDRRMVDLFLSGRRSQMRISEESGTTAFV